MSADAAVDVIVSGHLCLDLLPRMANVPAGELLTPGRMFEVGPLEFSTGGAVSNTGLALHRLGVSVRLMATVGDDLVGRLTLAFLEDRDPALTRYISVEAGRLSAYTVVLSPQKVDRIFLHYPGPNTSFDGGALDFSLVAQARLFHLGYPSALLRLMADDGAPLEAIYRQAKAAGVVTSLDTAMPDPQRPAGRVDWHRILRRALPHVDLFVPSIEEIMFMLRRADYDTWRGQVRAHLTAAYLAGLADELLAMGAVIVGFKLGEMGVYLQAGDASRFERLVCLPLSVSDWAGARVWAPAYRVEVVGTTGAGDSAYAGLLAALLRGMGPLEAARWACAVGACNVEAADATSGVRTWEATAARMAAGWPVRELRLPGFEPDE